MPMSKLLTMAAVFAAANVFVGSSELAVAQQSTDVIGELGDNQGIFVDGKTFKIVKGTAKGDPTAAIAKIGAKEIAPGVILFRHGDKLYGVETTPELSQQAMRNFQDNWNVSYMKAMTNFQDNWNVSYIKSFQDNWNVSFMKDKANEPYVQAMKDFQDNWNVSYMKAAKDFQDNWNVSYMKDFQDRWNISYMNAVKNFQDNWATSYMK